MASRAFDGLAVVEKRFPAIRMNCDNQTIIVKAKSSKDNMQSAKHIRRLKSIKHLRNPEVIVLDYIQSAKNLADPLTNGLSRVVIENALREMCMRPT